MTAQPLDPRGLEAQQPGLGQPAKLGELDRRIRELERALAFNASTFAGAVQAAAFDTPPAGWLLCDGSTVGRLAYPALYAAIGTTFGAGDGSTTFGLPDLRGRMVVGKGTHAEVDALTDNDGLAVSARKVKHRHGPGSINITSSGGHVHTHTGVPSNGSFSVASGGTLIGTSSAASTITSSNVSHIHATASFAGFVGDTAGPLDGPAYQVLNYFVKT